MNKFLLTSLFISCSILSHAAPLTPEQALVRSGLVNTRGGNNAKELSLIHTAKIDNQEFAYVFNRGNDGFVVLSADDLAFPVLGYSDSGRFDENNIPPQMQWWLDQYGAQIGYVRNASLNIQPDSPEALVDPSWEAIPVMLSTKWNQNSPFNNLCPKVGSVVCPTGCVATAMAQVMNFFKYPESGVGKISYNCSGIGNLSLDLNDRPFDWDNMLNYYPNGGYNSTQSGAVAYLMQAAGYSVSMNYSAAASGTASARIAGALIKYFQYDGNVSFENRDSYNTIDWIALIYNNLKNVGPVIYNGTDPDSSGHSFVCDGYDGAGYFHFNWGWGGVSDGYFSVNAVNPEALGTGGGTGGGFIFSQDICLGIQKPTGEEVKKSTPYLTSLGALMVDSMEGSQLKVGQYGNDILGWMNQTVNAFELNVGVVFENQSSHETTLVSATLGTSKRISLDPGTYYPYVNTFGSKMNFTVTIPSSLPDGKYKTILVTIDASNPDEEYTEVQTQYPLPNYVWVEKTGSIITASTAEIPKPNVTGIDILSKLYVGRNVISQIDFENYTDYELTYAYSIALLNADNSIAYKGSPSLITVLPGSSLQASCQSMLTKVDGSAALRQPTDYTLALFNESVNELVGTFGTVTLEPNPGAATAQMRTFTIQDAEKVTETLNNQNINVYMVDDPSNFTISAMLKISKGYFDSELVVSLSQVSPYNEAETIPINEDLFNEFLILSEGDEYNFEIPVSFPEAQADVLYVIEAKYALSYSYRKLSTLRFRVGSAGVEFIEEDIDTPVEYYNLQGVKVNNPHKGELLIERKGNTSRKIIF